jgi:hypothetical protein
VKGLGVEGAGLRLLASMRARPEGEKGVLIGGEVESESDESSW